MWAAATERYTTVGGDFFAAVPPGGDAYVFAQILHDWDDAHCIAVLRLCRRAMPDHCKLLVVEPVLPGRGTGPREVARPAHADAVRRVHGR